MTSHRYPWCSIHWQCRDRRVQGNSGRDSLCAVHGVWEAIERVEQGTGVLKRQCVRGTDSTHEQRGGEECGESAFKYSWMAHFLISFNIGRLINIWFLICSLSQGLAILSPANQTKFGIQKNLFFALLFTCSNFFAIECGYRLFGELDWSIHCSSVQFSSCTPLPC